MASASLIPRSFWYLMGVVAMVGAWLLFGGGDDETAATLVPFGASDIARLTVGDAASTYILTRTPAGWELGGDCPDHVSDDDVESLAADLASAPRSVESVADFGPHTGSEYGLTDVRALTLRVESLDGDSWAVTVGGVNDVTGAAYVLPADDDRVYLTSGEVRAWLMSVTNALRADDVWPGFDRAVVDTLELAGPAGSLLFARDDLARWWLRDDGRTVTGPVADYLRFYDDRVVTVDDARWLRADNRTLRNLTSAADDAVVNVFHAAGSRAQPAPAAGLRLRVARRDGGEHELVMGDVNDLHLDAWRDGCPSGLVTSVDLLDAATDVFDAPLRDEVLTHGLAFADSFALELTGWPTLTVAAHDGDWVPLRRPGIGRDLRNQIKDMAVLLDRLAMVAVDAPADADADAVFADAYRLTLRTWQSKPGLPGEQVVVFGVARDRSRVVGRRPADGMVCEVSRDVLISARALISGM